MQVIVSENKVANMIWGSRLKTVCRSQHGDREATTRTDHNYPSSLYYATMRERLLLVLICLIVGSAAPYAVATFPSAPTENFHIQGWRWHTQSLARDAKRLSRLANAANSDEGYLDLKRATEYTVDFNMRGLHRIEADVFFPWVRETVVSAASSTSMRKEIQEAIQQLETDRRHLEKLGKSLVSLLPWHIKSILTSSHLSPGFTSDDA